jgi:hypothetical protein
MFRLVKRLPLPLPLLCASASAAEQRPGPPAQMSVSAMSSGAVMANQPHIAHSAEIMGAAMIASGLYGCAVLHAIGRRRGGSGLPGGWTLPVDASKFTSSLAAQARRRVRRQLS